MPDAERCRRIAILVREGYSERMVLSTDTCRRSQLHRMGGRGFDYLFRSIIPDLLQAGVSEQDIRQMTVGNPARILSRVA
jgi:phosphotriesterase-related protein